MSNQEREIQSEIIEKEEEIKMLESSIETREKLIRNLRQQIILCKQRLVTDK